MGNNRLVKIVLISPPLSMDKQAGSLKDIANILLFYGRERELSLWLFIGMIYTIKMFLNKL